MPSTKYRPLLDLMAHHHITLGKLGVHNLLEIVDNFSHIIYTQPSYKRIKRKEKVHSHYSQLSVTWY